MKRSDLLRYLLVMVEGGIYSDMLVRNLCGAIELLFKVHLGTRYG